MSCGMPLENVFLGKQSSESWVLVVYARQIWGIVQFSGLQPKQGVVPGFVSLATVSDW